MAYVGSSKQNVSKAQHANRNVTKGGACCVLTQIWPCHDLQQCHTTHSNRWCGPERRQESGRQRWLVEHLTQSQPLA